MKKNYLSLLFRSRDTVFTLKDLALLWQDSNTNAVKSRINHYVKRGELVRLRRGIYVKDKDYDRWEMATKIFTPAYVSLETVLAREGVIFQYYSQIFAVSYLSREIVCDGQKYVFKKIKNSVLTNSLGLRKEKGYLVASKERALLDALYLYHDYYFDNLSSLDWDFCFELLSIYGDEKLVKKLKSYQRDARHH